MRLLTQNITIFVYALLSFFFLNFEASGDSIVLLPKEGFSLCAACIVAFLFLLYKKLAAWYPKEYKKGFHVAAFILSAFFSFVSVMGVFFSADLSISISQLAAGSFIQIFIVFAGGFVLFYFALGAIGVLRERIGHRVSLITDRKQSSGLARALHKAEDFVFGKKSCLKTILIMALCWLPHIIIRYPGSMPADGVNSLLQYYGVREYTTQHPIIYTQLLGRLCDLGDRIHDTSLGFFFMVLLQTLTLLLVLAYTLRTMNRLGVPRWCTFAALVIFSVVPVFPGYATLLIIDVFYCAAILLLMNELAWYLFYPDVYKKSWTHLCLTAVSVLFAFFRQNGFYVIAVLLLFVAIREFCLILKKEQTIRYAILILAFLAVPLGIGKVNTSLLHKKYNASNVSARAMLAMPIQQIARYVVSYGDEMEPEELESIQRVLDWEVSEFRENYNPYNFDGIKRGFRFDATSEDIKDFLKTWFRLFLKHPETYVNATLHQNYCLFSPLVDNSKYYYNVRKGLERIEDPDFSPVYEIWEQKSSINEKLMNYYRQFDNIPFLGLYVNQGVMTLLLLGICLYALFDKNPRLLLLALPLLLTLGVTFIGPAAYGHPRYLFPILYSMPLLFGIFLTGKGKAAAITNKR